MKRKEFIKKSSFALAVGVLVPQISCLPKKIKKAMAQTETRKNWAGNYTYEAEKNEKLCIR